MQLSPDAAVEAEIRKLEAARDGSEITSAEGWRPEIGIYKDLLNQVYHRSPGISSTSLKVIGGRSPAHYQHERRNPVFKAAYDFGNGFHSAIFDRKGGFAGECGIAKPEVKSRRGAKWQSHEEVCRRSGLVPLTIEEADRCQAMAQAVLSHPIGVALLNGGYGEYSWWGVDEGTRRLTKCRPDYDRPDLGILLDYKSCEDATKYMFDIRKFWYDLSAKLYLDITGRKFFVWFFVEKTEPYGIKVIQASKARIEIGAAKLRHSLTLYDQCKELDEWPGYPEVIEIDDVTGWERNEWSLEKYTSGWGNPEPKVIW